MSGCIVPQNMLLDKDGYPRFKFGKRIWRMNRFMWTQVYGPIPNNMVVGHKCNNKSCINTNHMYLTTPEQNSTDAAKDGLYRRGDSHPKTRRKDSVCLEMHRLYHEEERTQQHIGDLFGVTQSRVSEAIRRANRILKDTR